MESEEIADDVIETVERRGNWRRAEDIRNRAIVIGLSTLLVAGGIAWGTARAAVDQKVDRDEFHARVALVDKRFLSDSILNSFRDASLKRIEAKQDSMNARLSLLICEDKPMYCR